MSQKIPIEDYPSNSNKSKEETIEEKRIEPVVKGKVTQQKKSFGRRAKEVIMGDDSRNVAEYVIQDILVPALKSLLSDVVGGGLDMMLFGETRGRRSRVNRDREPYTSYDKQFDRNRGRSSERKDNRTYIPRSLDDLDIVFESRMDAAEVFDVMREAVDQYGSITVSEFKEKAGVRSEYTDRNYGWDDLGGVYISPVRGGYLINLPRPIHLR